MDQIGNIISQVGTAAGSIGNAVTNIIKGNGNGQNASNQPSTAATAARNTNIMWAAIAGFVVLLLAFVGWAAFGRKSK